MNKTTKTPLIAMLSGYPTPFLFTGREATGLDVTICQLDDSGSFPQNWSFSPYCENKPALFGGFTFHAWQHDNTEGGVSFYTRQSGPQVQGNSAGEYTHAAKGLVALDKRESDLYTTRGNSQDIAERLGRWLEAIGINLVLVRPLAEGTVGWHNKGRWLHWTPGHVVNTLRSVIQSTTNANNASNVA